MAVRPTQAETPASDDCGDRGNVHEQGSLPTRSIVMPSQAVPGPRTFPIETVQEKTYRINEVFYSLQGEGMRAGTANVFVRFSGCNQTCKKETHGFDCDTEFASGRSLSLDEIHEWVRRELRNDSVIGAVNWLILTGGEPGLQVDLPFIEYFKENGYKLAIETNGSIQLPSCGGRFLPDPVNGSLLDWVTVSPKVAEHCIRQKKANEVKYVRGYGQGIPKTVVEAEHYLLSPAFAGNETDPEIVKWCIQLCLENPKWRLSVQQHKTWQIR